MSRVLEIVLSLSLEGWPVKAASRARGRSVISAPNSCARGGSARRSGCAAAMSA